MNKNKEMEELINDFLSEFTATNKYNKRAELKQEFLRKSINLITQAEDNMRKRCVEALQKKKEIRQSKLKAGKDIASSKLQGIKTE